MSKYVDEILKDLKENPETFRDYKGCGVQKNEIVVAFYGNTRVLSIISVYIKGNDIPLSYMDKWRLEVSIKKWYATIGLNILTQ
jgi:hypothetical protein